MTLRLSNCLGLISQEIEDGLDSALVKVEIFDRLECDRALSLQAAIKDLHFFSSGEDLYNFYQANIQDLLKAVVEFGTKYLNSGAMSDLIMSTAAFEFSRLTLNLLSMFKSFLDHGTAALIKRFGKESAQMSAWDAAQSAEYDRSSAYRFFYNLRNYAQHVGIPPLHFSLQDKSQEEGVGIALEFHRDDLLLHYSKWSKDCKHDLVTGPEKLFLLPLLDEWSFCFHRLVRMVQTVRSDEIMCSAKMIADIRTELGISEKGLLIFLPEPTLSDEGELNLAYQRIPEDKAKDIVERKFLKMLDKFQG